MTTFEDIRRQQQAVPTFPQPESQMKRLGYLVALVGASLAGVWAFAILMFSLGR